MEIAMILVVMAAVIMNMYGLNTYLRKASQVMIVNLEIPMAACSFSTLSSILRFVVNH